MRILWVPTLGGASGTTGCGGGGEVVVGSTVVLLSAPVHHLTGQQPDDEVTLDAEASRPLTGASAQLLFHANNPAYFPDLKLHSLSSIGTPQQTLSAQNEFAVRTDL